jgi:hypothetical protein
MGPDKGAESSKFSFADKTRVFIKHSAKVYFDKPLEYLFYGMLTLTVLGLFFGMKFGMDYDFILLSLAVANIYKSEFSQKNARK